ncbi:MAG: SecDF P1 head subdomain-containing protein, partial [Gemmatimonadaceae bacterium]
MASHLPCHSTQTKEESNSANCRGMTLGLDLKGGSRVTLEAEPGPGLSKADVADGINANKQIIDSRLNPFGVSESSVQVSGSNKLIVEAPGLSASQLKDLTRPAVLMWCEGLQQGGQAGAGSPLAVVPDGSKIYYKPGTCQADVDASGAVALKDATGNIAKNADGTIQRVTPTYTTTALSTPNNIVWTPAEGDLNGAPTIMTGQYLKRNTQVQFDSLGQPIMTFNMTSDGAKVFGAITRRIGDTNSGLPLANFLDGEPIRDSKNDIIAPRVQSEITDTGQTTGLTLDAAQKLKT